MKRFLCFALVMLMCLGGQALATPQWQNAEPVKAEDLPEGVREGLLEMNPNANTCAAGLAPGGAAPSTYRSPARTMQP